MGSNEVVFLVHPLKEKIRQERNPRYLATLQVTQNADNPTRHEHDTALMSVVICQLRNEEKENVVFLMIS